MRQPLRFIVCVKCRDFHFQSPLYIFWCCVHINTVQWFSNFVLTYLSCALFSNDNRFIAVTECISLQNMFVCACACNTTASFEFNQKTLDNRIGIGWRTHSLRIDSIFDRDHLRWRWGTSCIGRTIGHIHKWVIFSYRSFSPRKNIEYYVMSFFLHRFGGWSSICNVIDSTVGEFGHRWRDRCSRQSRWIVENYCRSTQCCRFADAFHSNIEYTDIWRLVYITYIRMCTVHRVLSTRFASH